MGFCTSYANLHAVEASDGTNTLYRYTLDETNNVWTLVSSEFVPEGDKRLFAMAWKSYIVWTSHDLLEFNRSKELTGAVLFEAGEQAGWDTTVEGEDASGGYPGYSAGSGGGDYSGFLGTIIGFLKNIFDAIAGPVISNLGSIIDGINSLGSSIADLASTVGEFIGNFFESLLDFLKSFFVPEDGWFEGKLDEVNDKFTSILGFDLDVFGDSLTSIVGTEQALNSDDYSTNLEMFSGLDEMSFTVENANFFDTQWVVQAADFFRPYIRGLLVILLGFFVVNQLFAITGYTGTFISGVDSSTKSSGSAFMVRTGPGTADWSEK